MTKEVKAKGANTAPTKTASVLAFERKLDPSDGHMLAGAWAERDGSASWPKIAIAEKSVRGTISNRLKSAGADSAKLDAEVQKPNLQRVDVASLPADADTVCIRFSLRVIAGAGTPSACNDANYQAKLGQTVDLYKQTHGFTALAERYATNLAMGRFMWRNRVGAEMSEVHIQSLSNGKPIQTWKFDAFKIGAEPFPSPNPDVQKLAKEIAEGLAGTKPVLLHVSGFARLGSGQEVFPSQELILDKGSKGAKSKTLYQVGACAAIHSQKLGNALRTIDTWYPDADGRPIAVEPYGSVTSEGKAYRTPAQKHDFYNLLDNWVIRDKLPPVEQQHYVMANLVRGGVFGEADKD